MEENLCILMSDLSGYTALTETHGAVSAADLIDRYVSIAEDCLVGDSHLLERTGDELMIISTSAQCLLATAVGIMNKTSNEPYFLQVHGGLHKGIALKRGGRYFGSAINLTSRIAAGANPGTFWCSREFVDSLPQTSSVILHPIGTYNFKNINDRKELFEIRFETDRPLYIDRVCRMLILDTSEAIKHPTSEELFFCSPACLDIYLKTDDQS